MIHRPTVKSETYRSFKITGPYTHGVVWTWRVEFPDGEHFTPGFTSIKSAKAYIDKQWTDDGPNRKGDHIDAPI